MSDKRLEELVGNLLLGFPHDKQIPQTMVGIGVTVTFLSSADLPCKPECRACSSKKILLPILEAGQAMRDCDPWGDAGDLVEAQRAWDAAIGAGKE
jgi:hypothetical protein